MASITSKVALGSADAGFAYNTDASVAGDRVQADPDPEVGAAAGPLPDVRRAPVGRRHRAARRRSSAR